MELGALQMSSKSLGCGRNPLVFTEESSKMLEEWKSYLKLAPPCTFIKWGTVSPTVAWNLFEDVLDFSLRCYWLKFRAEWYKKAQHAAEAVTGSAVLSACQRSRQWMTSLRTWKDTFSFQMSFQKCRNHRGADTTWGWQSCCFPMLVFDPRPTERQLDERYQLTRHQIGFTPCPVPLEQLLQDVERDETNEFGAGRCWS